MMVSMELPVATRAFFLGMRRVSRRWRAPRNGWVRPAQLAASPRAAPRVGVAAAGRVAALALSARLAGLGGPSGPGDQVGGGREYRHVGADLGDDVLGADDPDAVNLIQLPDLMHPGFDQHLDPGGELLDLGGVV